MLDENSELAWLGIGGYGPELLFVINNSDTLQRLRAIFHDLANRPSAEIEVLERARLRGDGINKVIARSTLSDHSNMGSFPSNRVIQSNASVLWTLTPDEWLTNSMLLEHDTAVHGWHQYLTDEGRDGLLITISYCEALQYQGVR